MSEITVRAFRDGDEKKINDTFNRVFSLGRSLEEWYWKFRDVPGGRPIMLAWLDGEICAHYGSLPARFQVDGIEWPAAQIVDVFSTREARRLFAKRGVWVKTVERYFLEFGESGRFPLLFGFPGKRALRLGVLQLGYDSVEPQPIRYLRRDGGTGSETFSRYLYRAELATEKDDRLDTLWQSARSDYPVAVIRDAARVATRLSGRPGVSYHRFLVFPRFSPTPVAFAAFRTDQGRCRWVDLVWDHGHRGALALLSLVGRRLAHSHGAAFEELWLNGDQAGIDFLRRRGFCEQPEPNGLVMVARSFNQNLSVATLDRRVYLTMADADLV